MRKRGWKGDMDEDYASATVADRAAMAEDHGESTFDPSPTVRTARAGTASLTEDEEDLLVGDSHSRVRAALARNRHTSPGALEALAADEDRAVREAVASHRRTPPATLAAMAEGLDRRRDLSVVQRLARNPHTPSEALRGWLSGGTGGQKTLAKGALRARAEAAAEAVLHGTERIGVGIENAADESSEVLDDLLGSAALARKVG